jgi:uncharacterized membrane protein YeaQ/YmgE (transglycosylase-associated protein family)
VQKTDKESSPWAIMYWKAKKMRYLFPQALQILSSLLVLVLHHRKHWPQSHAEKGTKEIFMIWTLIVGLIVGAIARFLMPGKDPGGFVVTMLLGVAGAIIANLIGTAAGFYNTGEPAGFVASVVGAVILLAIYRSVSGRNNRRPISH